MVCSNPKFGTGHNIPFLEKDHGILSKEAQKRLLIFNTSSERPISKLSENHKINVIGPTELKLWPFKDALLNIYYRTILLVSVGEGVFLSS